MQFISSDSDHTQKSPLLKEQVMRLCRYHALCLQAANTMRDTCVDAWVESLAIAWTAYNKFRPALKESVIHVCMYLALKEKCISLADRIRADLHIVCVRLGCKSFLSSLILFSLFFFIQDFIHVILKDPRVLSALPLKKRGEKGWRELQGDALRDLLLELIRKEVSVFMLSLHSSMRNKIVCPRLWEHRKINCFSPPLVVTFRLELSLRRWRFER